MTEVKDKIKWVMSLETTIYNEDGSVTVEYNSASSKKELLEIAEEMSDEKVDEWQDGDTKMRISTEPLGAVLTLTDEHSSAAIELDAMDIDQMIELLTKWRTAADE